jgi:hypothetical protein
MELDYNQRRELNAKISQTGESILTKLVMYGMEIVKFVVNFIADMIRQIMGK